MRARCAPRVLLTVLVLGALTLVVALAMLRQPASAQTSSSSTSSTLITVGDPSLSGGSVPSTQPLDQQTVISDLQRRLAAERDARAGTVPPADPTATADTGGGA